MGFKFGAIAGLALLVNAVGNGPMCHSVGASLATVSSNLRAANLPAAADGDFESFSTLMVRGSANASVRAAARSSFFPGEQVVGVYWSNPSAAAHALTLNTYLGGTAQESFPICERCRTRHPGSEQYDFAYASKPFDSIEVVLAGSPSNPAPAEFRIIEICDD